jgi:hypothetical protein
MSCRNAVLPPAWPADRQAVASQLALRQVHAADSAAIADAYAACVPQRQRRNAVGVDVLRALLQLGEAR